ncbi:MAG: hypothetical protein OXN90_16965 [Gemmatimonadota bacterium]|nr:hypothetical protein [Gemmatimonadota bacterium]
MKKIWISVAVAVFVFVALDVWATTNQVTTAQSLKELTHIWMPPAVIVAILLAIFNTLRSDLNNINRRIDRHLEGHP